MLQNEIAARLYNFLGGLNVEGTAFASAARTATASTSDITNYSAKGIKVVFDVTSKTDTPSVVLKVEGKDSLSGKYYTVLEGAAVTDTSTNVYTVYPGATAAANAVVSNVLPKYFRITMTHADADPITYSVGYCLI